MAGDLKSLLATWHQLSEEPLKMQGVLDLLGVHQKVILSHHSLFIFLNGLIVLFLLVRILIFHKIDVT